MSLYYPDRGRKVRAVCSEGSGVAVVRVTGDGRGWCNVAESDCVCDLARRRLPGSQMVRLRDIMTVEGAEHDVRLGFEVGVVRCPRGSYEDSLEEAERMGLIEPEKVRGEDEFRPRRQRDDGEWNNRLGETGIFSF